MIGVQHATSFSDQCPLNLRNSIVGATHASPLQTEKGAPGRRCRIGAAHRERDKGESHQSGCFIDTLGSAAACRGARNLRSKHSPRTLVFGGRFGRLS
jgi:hypothetical protein